MAEPSARPGRPGHSPSGPVRGPHGSNPYGTPPNAYPPPGPQTGNGYAPLGAPVPPPAPATPPRPQGKNVVRSSLLMGAGSLVSRVTGFGRTVVISAAIGAGLLGNSYTTAQYFPQMIYELVLGGVFASIIMPLFVKAHKNDPDGGDAFAQRLLTLAALVLGAAAILVTACAPLIARFMANPVQYDLVTEFSYYMLPALLLYGLFAILSGVLNSREHFGAPMWVPIINNLVVITVGALFYVIYTRDAVPNADGEIFAGADQVTNGMILLLGLGTTAGVVIQVVCLAPALRKAGFRWRWRFDFKSLPLGTIRRMAAWTLLFVAANQIAVMAVIKVANAASDSERTADLEVFVPGVTVYNNAYLMMMMAHGIVAVSVITALMPRMTRAADDRRWPELADHLSNGIRLASFLLVPIAAAFIALHEPIALMIFQWGAYMPAEALATGQVLLMAGIVLLPFSVSQLQIYAFYAQTDTKAVAMFNLPVIAIRIGGYLLAFAFLPAQWVVVGLFASNGVSYLVSLLLSMSLLRKRIGLLGMRKTMNGLVRTTTAAVIAGGVAYGGWLLWPDLPVDGAMAKLGQFGASIVLGLVLLGVYFAACLVLRVTETASLQATVRAKLRR
jgi:putative peptidoglycan lipid II flippase